MIEKALTGIEGFDRISQGGIPRRGVTLLVGPKRTIVGDLSDRELVVQVLLEREARFS